MAENSKAKKIIYIERVLRFMASAVLKTHSPKIVAITGSVGKTSTKAAIFKVLSAKFSVRENQKNYNNEIGIPLTIIGAESGGRNIFKWALVFFKWISALLDRKYPEILVLELGIDRPGDMKYFMSFIRPIIGIVTNVSFSHIEFFKTIENIAKEKRVIIENLSVGGIAILNADDGYVLNMANHTNREVMTFGLSKNANICGENIIYNYNQEKPAGISFKLNYDGNNIPVRLKNLLAGHYVYAALAAIAAGTFFKMNLVEIANSLQSLKSPTGRMNLLDGINGSYIIDDTYNASPVSMLAALEVLSQLKSKRKIAILADMLELGDKTEFGHRQIAKKIFSINADMFVAVGDRMKFAIDELNSLGYNNDKIAHFDNPNRACEFVASIISQGDYVLVKGSQSMRMEKIVAKLLKNTSQAKNLLCRQNETWLNKPFIKP